MNFRIFEFSNFRIFGHTTYSQYGTRVHPCTRYAIGSMHTHRLFVVAPPPHPPPTSLVARRRRGTWQSVTLRHHLCSEVAIMTRVSQGCTNGCRAGDPASSPSSTVTCSRCFFLAWMTSAQDNRGWHTIVYGQQDDSAANRRRVAKWSPAQEAWSP